MTRRFWRFVKLRQRAWAAKNGLCSPVVDETMRRARFTNVFRALDRGTLFAIERILWRRPVERVWCDLMYRAMNRIDSYTMLANGGPSGFSGASFADRCSQWRALGQKVFTGVYYSSHTLHGYALPGPGSPMDLRLAAYGDELARNALMLAERLAGVGTLEDAFLAIRSATIGTLLGPFMCFQAALDLGYGQRWADDWAHIGPGARKALTMLGRPRTIDALRALALSQPVIPFAPDGVDGVSVRLSVPDVEHALCEWQKYERIKAGGHAKGTYSPTTGWTPSQPIPRWWRMP